MVGYPPNIGPSGNNHAHANAVALVQSVAERLLTNITQVIRGKRKEVGLVILGLLAQGHILIEDKPGVGKTTLAKALARSTGCSFKRIQFTPDMQPSAVTGTSVYIQNEGRFRFQPGPIFAQIILADEINRATPKTQSALLEAMEESQVTVDLETYRLEQPFFIMATQNPIDYEGTYPLPEAQMDRFLLRIELGYPGEGDELVMLYDHQNNAQPIANLTQVVKPEELLAAQNAVRNIYVKDDIARYIIDLVNATRNRERYPQIELGASPRGSLALFRAAQVQAAIAGRDYVLPDDVKVLAEPTLAHRLILEDRSMGARHLKQIMQDIIRRVPVPGTVTR